jgi:alkylation response protein AidB-like acyl-CoA dehydrogenase
MQRAGRVALSAAFDYAMTRKAFGKTLMDQPVVRHRLALAGAQLEANAAWLESIVFQLSKMKKADADEQLGGITAMAKAHTGRVLQDVAINAQLIFGGNGLTRGGKGLIAESEPFWHLVALISQMARQCSIERFRASSKALLASSSGADSYPEFQAGRVSNLYQSRDLYLCKSNR